MLVEKDWLFSRPVSFRHDFGHGPAMIRSFEKKPLKDKRKQYQECKYQITENKIRNSYLGKIKKRKNRLCFLKIQKKVSRFSGKFQIFLLRAVFIELSRYFFEIVKSSENISPKIPYTLWENANAYKYHMDQVGSMDPLFKKMWRRGQIQKVTFNTIIPASYFNLGGTVFMG